MNARGDAIDGRLSVSRYRSGCQPLQKPCFSMARTLPEKPWALGVRTRCRRLQDQRFVEIGGRPCADMLHLVPGRRAKEVETQAVGSRLDQAEQGRAQRGPLCGIDGAFEHRILHPHAMVLASPRHAAQTAPASRGFGGNVVTDQDKHRVTATGREGRRRGRRAGGAPAGGPERATSGRRAVSRSGRGDSAPPSCASGRRPARPCGHRR